MCIGIDNYPDAPLLACVADAVRWADVLATLDFEVQILKDQMATRACIEAAIAELLETTSDGGQAVIQFAGHATQLRDPTAAEDDDLSEALVPFDYLSGGCITSTDFTTMLLPHAGRLSVTLFFDCSHPGSKACAAAEGGQADLVGKCPQHHQDSGRRRRYLPLASPIGWAKFGFSAQPKSTRTDLARDTSLATRWVHVAAAQVGEFAYETIAGGEFTLAALRFLPKAIKEQWLPVRFLDAVRSAIPSASGQTPQLQLMSRARAEQPLLGHSPSAQTAFNATTNINALSLRELIRAVDALSFESPDASNQRR
ncbi:MAG: caspase family protein [Pseudomarimonas sp.]